MVIYDTKDNYGGNIKGMLYMSMMDVDYLVKKYGSGELREMIPEDYVEGFERELKDRECEGVFSLQYYSILPIGIETKEDERLLSLLSQEVEMGNLLAKCQLSSLTLEELEKAIEELDDAKLSPDDASLEDIYKLRSFMMAKFIIMSIQGYNRSVERAYLGINLVNSQKNIMDKAHDFEAMGITSDICESDYFDKAIMMSKRFTGNK
ncbi:MAG: hypothetical protein K2G03_00890 [Bacilli bacterium]|nr:hypothetical protein [Bacilli bacterium]MDE6141135.1 hypothetical protein [Bacilli bacterium]